MYKTTDILNRVYALLNITDDKEFCGIYEIKPNTLSTWRTRNTIPYDLLMRISKEHNISLDTIFFDKMRISDDNLQLRYYTDVAAAAGYGAINSQLEYTEITMSKKFACEALGLPPLTKLDIIKIIGDSMEPFIHSGDVIAVDVSKNKLDLVKNGDIVVINLDGEIYCKKLLKQPFVDEIVLSSMNSFYKDIVVSVEQINSAEIIGVVCKAMSIKTFENAIIKYE
ncbi:LexA family transcriptional regulator [Campylobacter volucris]|uniref:LexA family transcriptional regulator n=1 Tax=Campylobacter volucris TaxID=1031542 RepID=UPI00189FDBA2|nr:S24 family peptidase [Campylobacter volucris]EGK8127724.1 signal peptidase [Campylobacter lari]MBF7060508.1 LexA family transcriptional regulator [Campylobacter volucris]